MIVLLDTHALIWSPEDSPRLSATARKLIEDTSNVVLASVASGWEIAIKAASESAGFIKRAITFADVHRHGSLPSHHKDPFDRMLVAQAMEDGVPLVSCDPLIEQYQVQIIW
jgi:PIN domain nuclease of toxin-antitoxin system